MTDIEIAGKKCHLYENNILNDQSGDIPIIFWGMERHSGNEDRLMEEFLRKLSGDKPYIIVAFETDNWNTDFSIWEVSELGFSGGGEETLHWLADRCIPYVEKYYTEDCCEEKHHGIGEKRNRTFIYYIAGYSLAGLFSLWAFYSAKRYSNQIFRGVICCSGSLWYPKWKEFMEGQIEQRRESRKNGENVDASGRGYVYLSLGVKEEHTKNKLMSTVGDMTREQERYLSMDSGVAEYTLEWNNGGHFTEPEKRMAKGIAWILNQSEK